jgi:hypothetical protein
VSLAKKTADKNFERIRNQSHDAKGISSISSDKKQPSNNYFIKQQFNNTQEKEKPKPNQNGELPPYVNSSGRASVQNSQNQAAN